MTFFEAAVEILKESGRPLHYKKLTELAVQRSLLSHVGKSPESTMQTLLTDEAKKGAEAAVVLVRNGVFALASHADPSAIVSSLTTTVTLGEPKKKKDEPSPRRPGRTDADAEDTSEEGDEDRREGRERDERDDDDAGGRGRGRRRRRGRGRGGAARESGEERTNGRGDAEEPRDEERDGKGKKERDKDRDKGRDKDKKDRKREERDDDDKRGRHGKDERRERPRRESAPARVDVLGALLDALDDARGPLSAQDLADDLAEGKAAGVTALVVAQVLSAANARRTAAGKAPAAILTASGWSGTERLLGKKLGKRHDELQEVFEGLREETVSAVSKHIQRLDGAGLRAFATAVLVASGCAVDQLEADDDEVVLRATPAGGLQPFPVAALVRLSDDKLGADDIAAFRGRFERYGVTRGIILTPRRSAGSDAEAEAGASVALFTADAYAALAVDAGVGVTYYDVRVPLPDPAHFAGDRD
jgi:Rod binding domain-containing protein